MKTFVSRFAGQIASVSNGGDPKAKLVNIGHSGIKEFCLPLAFHGFLKSDAGETCLFYTGEELGRRLETPICVREHDFVLVDVQLKKLVIVRWRIVNNEEYQRFNRQYDD